MSPETTVISISKPPSTALMMTFILKECPLRAAEVVVLTHCTRKFRVTARQRLKQEKSSQDSDERLVLWWKPRCHKQTVTPHETWRKRWWAALFTSWQIIWKKDRETCKVGFSDTFLFSDGDNDAGAPGTISGHVRTTGVQKYPSVVEQRNF